LLKLKVEKQQKHSTQEKKNLVQACKVRGKPDLRERCLPIPRQKSSHSTCFLKITKETIGIEKMIP